MTGKDETALIGEGNNNDKKDRVAAHTVGDGVTAKQMAERSAKRKLTDTDGERESCKKTVIIQVLRILYCYTSAECPVNQTQIAEYLGALGISCTRKTVGRNLSYLMECGVPIKRKVTKNGGYYYDIENDSFFVRRTVG